MCQRNPKQPVIYYSRLEFFILYCIIVYVQNKLMNLVTNEPRDLLLNQMDMFKCHLFKIQIWKLSLEMFGGNKQKYYPSMPLLILSYH